MFVTKIDFLMFRKMRKVLNLLVVLLIFLVFSCSSSNSLNNTDIIPDSDSDDIETVDDDSDSEGEKNDNKIFEETEPINGYKRCYDKITAGEAAGKLRRYNNFFQRWRLR